MKNRILKIFGALFVLALVLSVSILPTFAATYQYREPELVAYLSNRAQMDGGKVWEVIAPSTTEYMPIQLKPNTAYVINLNTIFVTDDYGTALDLTFTAWGLELSVAWLANDDNACLLINEAERTYFGPGRSNNIGIYEYFGEVGSYDNGYKNGYENGYSDGFFDSADGQGLLTPEQAEQMAEEARQQGIIDGRVGYITEEESSKKVSDAYSQGLAIGEEDNVTQNFLTLVSEIAFAPYRAISTMFDFEIFGINIAGFIFQFFTLVVSFFVIAIIFKFIF